MQNFIKIIILSLYFGLFSCSSTPPFLSPSKALVNTSVIKMGKSIPQKYSEFLNTNIPGNNIVVNDQIVSLGEYYTSALGQQCRILYIAESKLNLATSSKGQSTRRKRIVCKQDESDSWVLIPAIVERVKNKAIFSD